MGTYGRYDVVMECGENQFISDDSGKTYIDFGSGIGTNSLGFCNEDWVAAVCAQAQTLQHTSNYYYTKIQADFAAKLCKLTGYSNVFFGNSGAEANEGAIKLARKYSFDKYGRGRHKIFTLENSFHGRTLCTLSATGQDVFHNYFFPFAEGFEHVEINNFEAIKAKLDGTVCAVMIEFVQGEGGVIPLESGYVKDLFALCAEKDILVIADEVQTGVGRTGKFLASEHFGVKPNITTLAKGLAGGLPMGAVLADELTKDVLGKGTHGSTFGGNPICCAGGNVVINKVSNSAFLDEVNKKGAYIKGKILQFDGVKSVEGLGLMLGITLENEGISAADIAKMALDNGLLILTAKEKVRFLPPLTITYEEIDKGLKILEKIFNQK